VTDATVNPSYAELEWACLAAFDDWIHEARVPAAMIAEVVQAPVGVVKAVLRELVDTGMLTYGPGFDDAGMICGSGHSLSDRGVHALAARRAA
jgi:hypothetical protein